MATATLPATATVEQLLGDQAASLLEHRCETVPQSLLHLPGPDFVDRVWAGTDRSNRVLRNLSSVYEHGRLGGTGYVSILPVDQGIEHSAGASFAPNPEYFDGGRLVELAINGGCNAMASTFGVLGSVSRKYAHRIPFILKINHNELLTYPNKFDQILFGTVREAWNLGAVAVGLAVSGTFPLWLGLVIVGRYLVPALAGAALIAADRRPELRHTVTGQISTSLIIVLLGGICLFRFLKQDAGNVVIGAEIVIPIATAATMVHLAWLARRPAAPEPG